MVALIDLDIVTYRIGFSSNDVNWPICRSRVDEFLENLLVFHLDVDDYEGWLTDGSNNFRNAIAKTQPYKGQRKGDKPVHYEAIRNYLVSSWGAKVETEQEADDAIGIRATELGDDCVICTIDKDLDNIPGHHFNFVKNERCYVTVESALRNFYRQILTGDRIDNVQGLRGIGPVKADRILGYSSLVSSEYYRKVVEAYGGDSQRVIENAQLLWIRTKPGEIWQPPAETVKEVNDPAVS
jgi:hypothetical protein